MNKIGKIVIDVYDENLCEININEKIPVDDAIQILVSALIKLKSTKDFASLGFTQN